MMNSLVLKKDFDRIKDIVTNYGKMVEINFIWDDVKKGYKQYKIGEEIKFIFNDGVFGSYEMEGIVLDILIEKEDNFGLLLIPKDYDNFFPSMNALLKEFGIENLSIPKEGCFFAKHLRSERFSLETETKMITTGVQVTLPKLFRIPEQTIKKILVYYKVSESKQFCLKRIIEGYE